MRATVTQTLANVRNAYWDLVFARSAAGIDFGGDSEQPSTLLFLIAAPAWRSTRLAGNADAGTGTPERTAHAA